MAVRVHDIHITFIFLSLRLSCHDSAYLESSNKFTSSFLWQNLYYSSFFSMYLLISYVNVIPAKWKNPHCCAPFHHPLPFSFFTSLFFLSPKLQIPHSHFPASTKSYGKLPIGSLLFSSSLLQLYNLRSTCFEKTQGKGAIET